VLAVKRPLIPMNALGIGCLLRQNGNTRAAQEQQVSSGLAMERQWGEMSPMRMMVALQLNTFKTILITLYYQTMLGSVEMPPTAVKWLAKRKPMTLVCMICMEMSGNGQPIGMTEFSYWQNQIPSLQHHQPIQRGCSVVEAGTLLQEILVSLIVDGTFHPTNTM